VQEFCHLCLSVYYASRPSNLLWTSFPKPPQEMTNMLLGMLIVFRNYSDPSSTSRVGSSCKVSLVCEEGAGILPSLFQYELCYRTRHVTAQRCVPPRIDLRSFEKCVTLQTPWMVATLDICVDPVGRILIVSKLETLSEMRNCISCRAS
jgi:hypothetical protein